MRCPIFRPVLGESTVLARGETVDATRRDWGDRCDYDMMCFVFPAPIARLLMFHGSWKHVLMLGRWLTKTALLDRKFFPDWPPLCSLAFGCMALSNEADEMHMNHDVCYNIANEIRRWSAPVLDACGENAERRNGEQLALEDAVQHLEHGETFCRLH